MVTRDLAHELRNTTAILVVDDEYMVLKLIVDLLKMLQVPINPVVYAAGSPEEALDILKSFEIDLLITDVAMSGMSGIELYRKAKRFYPELQCIVITGYGTMDTAIAALKLDVYDFLHKPLNSSEFIGVVEGCLKKIHHKRKIDEELRRRIGETEYKLSRQKNVEQELLIFKTVIDESSEAIAIWDEQGQLVFANAAHEKLFGRPSPRVGRFGFRDCFPPESAQLFVDNILPGLIRGEVWSGELEGWDVTGRRFTLQGWIDSIRDEHGGMLFSFCCMHNVTELPGRDEIEEGVGEEKYKKTKRELEEANNALSALLKKLERDKLENQQHIMCNVKELIEPYCAKLKATNLDERQKNYLQIIESNLQEITSPFARSLTLKNSDLTPTELKVANLVRHGMSIKEVADTMNLSPQTIKIHRKQIRKKLGISKTKQNLHSFLISYPESPENN